MKTPNNTEQEMHNESGNSNINMKDEKQQIP